MRNLFLASMMTVVLTGGAWAQQWQAFEPKTFDDSSATQTAQTTLGPITWRHLNGNEIVYGVNDDYVQIGTQKIAIDYGNGLGFRSVAFKDAGDTVRVYIAIAGQSHICPAESYVFDVTASSATTVVENCEIDSFEDY